MRNVKQWVAALLLIALSLTNCLAVSAEFQSADESMHSAVLEEPMKTDSPEKTQETAVPEEMAEQADKETTQSTTIQASVPSAGASYSVVIPESVHLGMLDANQDFRQAYTVSVEVYDPQQPISITVSAPESFPMLHTEQKERVEQMTCYNAFETTTFQKSSTADGLLTIPKAEIAAAAPGRYTGTLEFTIRSQQQGGGETPAPEETPRPTETVSPTATPNPTAIPTAVPTATPQPTSVPRPTATPQPTADNLGSITEDGQYTATVSMRKETDFQEISMCNKLFYPKADIERKGDMATVTLYVVDPVPQFANDGTPLRDMSLTYDGKTYPVRVNSSNQVMKHFDAASGFIPTAGEYSASSLVVTLPVKALTDSVQGKLTSKAFVSAVMKQNVDFYVVFTDMTAANGKPSNKPANKKPASAKNDAKEPDLQTLTMDDGEKSWYMGTVSMRRADRFDQKSMCDPLFFEKADILYQGDTAELTLYVIDPVPKFSDAGTPIKDVKFLYGEKAYAAAVQKEASQKKHFEEAAGFIPSAGEYAATPIKVILPKQAIAESEGGKLKCSAYINTVMNATQEFYVVLSDLEEGQPPVALQNTEDEQKKNETVEQPQLAVAPAPKGIRLHTKLFPQVLVYGLFTAMILGGTFAVQWFRRK